MSSAAAGKGLNRRAGKTPDKNILPEGRQLLRTITFIRHGFTAANLESRYVGARTDCGLSEEGKRLLLQNASAGLYPEVDTVFSGPMLRCRETAGLIYPEQTPALIPGLTEMDFGDFEGKNFSNLDGKPDFQAYIDSGGSMPFPGGEDRASFTKRTLKAWRAFLDDFLRVSASDISAAVIVNSGSLMAIASETAEPVRDYFDWHVSPGEGMTFSMDSSGRLVYQGSVGADS